MVNAHLSQMQESGYMHAVFQTDNGFRVSSDLKCEATSADTVNEQLLFENRNTISKTLIGFLQQRKVALKHHQMGYVAAELFDIIYSNRMKHFDELVKIIKYQSPKFFKIMPKPESRMRKHFLEKIEPILSFCIGTGINGG